MENRHIYGVFLRIKELNNPNSRIFVMEIPTGKFISGKIATKTLRGIELRHTISVDMQDVKAVDDVNEIVSHKNYNIQPSVYPNEIDINLLG